MFFSSVCISASAIMLFNAIKMMDSQYFSFMVFISFGGLAPVVMNLRVRMWMSSLILLRNYIDMPSKCGLVIDFLNLIIVIFGVALAITICPRDYDNIVSIALSALSGIFMGLGLAEIKILCSFKTIRDKMKQ